MRRCKKSLRPSFLILFVCAGAAFSASVPNAKQATITDTTLLIDDLADTIVAKKTSAAPIPTSPVSPKDTAAALKVMPAVSPVHDSEPANTKAMFKILGSYYRASGIYNIAAGMLAVLAGAAILNKEDILPFSLSLITLGGITVGIGVWDVSIGNTLSK
jgi:hypothetical protein